jgi:hypothetical protein|tara:strand:+ start:1852 stop:2811 length:960 start_codon:yes stop_codon:yes gene_type:complete
MAASTLRYPLEPPVIGNKVGDGPTQAIDYVMFRRKRIKYKKDGGSGNYNQLNLPGNDVSFDYNSTAVYLAMPPQLATSYNPAYTTQNLGVGGMAMAGISGITLKEAGGEGMQADLDSIVSTLQDAATGALPEVINSAKAQFANAASQMLGIGGNINANTIAQLAGGKVFNPYTEQLFNNMTFRSHAFNFKLFSRSPEEARENKMIIDYFKRGATPIINDSPNRFMEVPDKFDIKFVRMDPEKRQFSDDNELHFKIFTSVCAGVNVNYTPDGQYNAFAETSMGTSSEGDGAPMMQVPAVTLSLTFLETRFIGQADVVRGY